MPILNYFNFKGKHIAFLAIGLRLLSYRKTSKNKMEALAEST